jgi:hypothetical protein
MPSARPSWLPPPQSYINNQEATLAVHAAAGGDSGGGGGTYNINFAAGVEPSGPAPPPPPPVLQNVEQNDRRDATGTQAVSPYAPGQPQSVAVSMSQPA